MSRTWIGFVFTLLFLGASTPRASDWDSLKTELEPGYRPRNMVPPLEELGEHKELPVRVGRQLEHRRGALIKVPSGVGAEAVAVWNGSVYVWSEGEVYALNEQNAFEPADVHVPSDASLDVQASARIQLRKRLAGSSPVDFGAEAVGRSISVNDAVRVGDTQWIGTETGLFRRDYGSEPIRHEHYGVDGPLASRITAMAASRDGSVWIGTPVGLTRLISKGPFKSLRGIDGLPYEDITALTVDAEDNLWIGTTRGLVHYRPSDSDRVWFYRAGPRYLADDRVSDLALSADGRTVYVATPAGLSLLHVEATTLREKADAIEGLVNERHRRMGLVAACEFEDPSDTASFVIRDQPNDGLWTAYHVTAMSLAYGATGEESYKESARTGMKALYMLQNASGVPGLPARSVLTPDEWNDRERRNSQAPRVDDEWHSNPDGTLYWRGDTSSDEYCGHYMAFFAYWEHIARHDAAEPEVLLRQVRAMTDYLIDHDLVVIDIDGKPTRWGTWNPKTLNQDPSRYLENGLNALQICSFLNTAFHVTGDRKYRDLYLDLMQEHDYLSNILTEKKVFPDEVNHSDDQLGFCAWYPILQTERDPRIRLALHQAVRRHWMVEEAERASFFTFVYATLDPNHADIRGGVRTLAEMPVDRRSWRMENSHRADVVFDRRPNRFGRRVLLDCLPADERNFEKWNQDPYEPDGGDPEGMREDSGASYLLAYWMGRYHGLFKEE
ncbi:MAG: hypothetical protein AMXMBFR84_38990 [Candidatus Hydrogenedentota bacterium]